jgi:hypothetical protein
MLSAPISVCCWQLHHGAAGWHGLGVSLALKFNTAQGHSIGAVWQCVPGREDTIRLSDFIAAWSEYSCRAGPLLQRSLHNYVHIRSFAG